MEIEERINLKTSINYILIACCTCKRPKMLMQALNSINELNLPDIKIELLIVDNDPNATAKNIVANFSEKSKIVVHYIVEPERGLANARNRVLKEAINLNASHLAFFDDDEIVDKNWLVEHVNFYNKNTHILISSGPTYNKFVKNYPAYITKNKVFKQSSSKKTGELRTHCASGNVFFPLSIIKEKSLFFEASYVFMGGEDGDFFSRTNKKGITIGWNNEAINYEMIGDERASLQWILKRQFYNGYSGAFLKFKNNKKLIRKIIYILRTYIVLISNWLLLLPSAICGPVIFLNALGLLMKTNGKIAGAIANKPLNFYKEICGE